MDIRELQRRAVAINHLYDRHNAAAGRAPWSGPDLAMGFVGDVGDVGDLVKLVMAVEDRRSIDDARARLGHELADCLWAVLVLADRYEVDLTGEFVGMTDELEQHLASDG